MSGLSLGLGLGVGVNAVAAPDLSVFPDVLLDLGHPLSTSGWTQVNGSTFGIRDTSPNDKYYWSDNYSAQTVYNLNFDANNNAKIDANETVLTIETTEDTHTDDDALSAIVKFYDGGGSLIHQWMNDWWSDNSPTAKTYEIAVPANARSCDVGYIAHRDSGTELSAYFCVSQDNYTVTHREASVYFTACRVLYSSIDPSTESGDWTNVTNAPTFSASANPTAFTFSGVGYIDGGSHASTECYQDFTVPAEFQSGQVTFEVSGLAANVNEDDRLNVEIEVYDSGDSQIGSTVGLYTPGTTANPNDKAHGLFDKIDTPFRITSAIDSAVDGTPSYVRIVLTWSRFDGTVSDGRFSALQLSVYK